MSVYEIAYFVARKALGKLWNIVKETCFLSMFPCLPTSENIVVETKFASQNVSQQIQRHFCCLNIIV